MPKRRGLTSQRGEAEPQSKKRLRVVWKSIEKDGNGRKRDRLKDFEKKATAACRKKKMSKSLRKHLFFQDPIFAVT